MGVCSGGGSVGGFVFERVQFEGNEVGVLSANWPQKDVFF